jgi:hypothetical protein
MAPEQRRLKLLTEDSFAALVRLFMSPANPKWHELRRRATANRLRRHGAASYGSPRGQIVSGHYRHRKSARRWCRRFMTALPIGQQSSGHP